MTRTLDQTSAVEFLGWIVLDLAKAFGRALTESSRRLAERIDFCQRWCRLSGSRAYRSDHGYVHPEFHTVGAGTKPGGTWFITDGIRITHTAGLASEWDVTILLIKDITVHIGDIQFPATLNASVEYTASPFVPRGIFLITHGHTEAVDVRTDRIATGYISAAAAVDNGTSIDEESMSLYSRNNQGVTQEGLGCYTDQFDQMAWIDPARCTIADFSPSTGNGFTCTNTGDNVFAAFGSFMLFDMPVNDLEVVRVTSPATPSTITAGTIDADAILGMQSTNSSGGFQLGEQSEGAGQYMASKDDGTQSSQNFWSNSNVTSSAMKSWTHNRVISVRQVIGSTNTSNSFQEASVSDWTAGVDLNYTVSDTQGLGWMLLLKGAAISTIKPTGAVSFLGETGGQVRTVHKPSGAVSFLGETGGNVLRDALVHKPTGAVALLGETGGRVVRDALEIKPTGTANLLGETGGQIGALKKPTGAGTLLGETGGTIVRDAAAIKPTGAVAFLGQTGGNVLRLAAPIQPTGSVDFLGQTGGKVAREGVIKAAGSVNLLGETGGNVTAIRKPTPVGTLLGQTGGSVVPVGLIKPSGVAAFLGQTGGRIVNAAAVNPTGVVELRGQTGGVVAGGIRQPIPKRQFATKDEDREFSINAPARIFGIRSR